MPLPPDGKLSLGNAWGQHDGAEVCVQAFAGKKSGPIYVIHGFANGQFESVTDAGATAAQAKALGNKTKYAVQAGTNQWTAEWGVPLALLGAKTRPGTQLRFNLGINRTSTSEWITWAGLSGLWM